MTTFTNSSKSSTTPTNLSRGQGTITFAQDVATWNAGTSTWINPEQVLTNDSRNTTSLTNQSRNT